MTEDGLLEFRTKALRQIREATDRIRTVRIPDYVAQEVPCRDAYFTFVGDYFANDVFLGQMAAEHDLARHAENLDAEFYRTSLADLTAPRTERVQSDGCELLHPDFLPSISPLYFPGIDSAPKPADEIASMQFTVLVELAFRLCHFTKDGTGKAGEDLCVYIGHKHGFPLTYSCSAYRGAVDGRERPILFRNCTQQVFHTELVRNFYRYLGAPVPEVISRNILDILTPVVQALAGERTRFPTWPGALRPHVDRLHDEVVRRSATTDPILQAPHPYRYYAEFLLKETIFLILCLGDAPRHYATALERYPLSVPLSEIDFRQAVRRRYLAAPTEAASLCDETVTRLDCIKMGHADDLTTTLERDLAALRETDPGFAALLAQEWKFGPSNDLLRRLRLRIVPGATAEMIRSGVASYLKLDTE